MKKIILIITTVAAFTFCNGQTKADSIELRKQMIFRDSILTKTPIDDFYVWLYKKATAEQYDILKQAIQLYISELYQNRKKK